MAFAPAQGYGEGPTHLMPEQGSDPIAILDAGTVYTKDVAGATELFYEDSAGNDVQLTSGGAVVGPTPGGIADNIQINNGAGGFGARLAINSSDQLLADDGSVAAPAITAASDTNTGIAFGVGGADTMTFVSGGVENFSAIPNVLSLTSRLLTLGHAASPVSLGVGNQGYGFFSRFPGQSLDVSMAGVLKMGFTRTTSGGSPATCMFMPETITSPLVHPSMCGFNSLDSGFSIGHLDNDNCAVFSNGLETYRWNNSGEAILDPILANSTGIVHDSAAVQTTDATVTTLYSKSLADDTVYVYSVLVTCRDTAGTERAAYARRVRVHRESAGVAVLGTIEAPYTDESDAGMNVTFTVSSNDIRVSVTGKAGTTINWAGQVTFIGAE